MADLKIPYIIHESPITLDYKIISKKNNRPIAKATLQDMDRLNRNRHFYESKELLPQLQSPRILELLSTGNLKGEAGHPMSEKLERQQTIDPIKVCCKYLKLWAEGNLIKALVTGTNNDLGESFNADLLDGERPSFSLRALGTLSRVNGISYVKKPCIITWDRVIYPSHKVAYTDQLINESCSLSENANEFLVDEKYDGKLIPIQNESVINYIKHESTNLDIMMDAFNTGSYKNVLYMENGNLRLYNEDGSAVIMRPEEYISKEIREFCAKK